jgi:acyl-CoA synthetase (AMP-forming)/AMP-acid ligase II
VVLERGAEATPEVLRARLRCDLSAYKVPRHLYIDALTDLPFTDSGKLDKRRLAKLLETRIATSR